MNQVWECNNATSGLKIFTNVMKITLLTSRIWQKRIVFTLKLDFNIILILIDNRILHFCSCILEFIKLVAKKENQCMASLAFDLFYLSSFNQFNKTPALILVQLLYHLRINNQTVLNQQQNYSSMIKQSYRMYQFPPILNVASSRHVSLSDDDDIALFKFRRQWC